MNPFRASIVLGTPGSGKSYAVVNNFIKQQIEKGFSMYVYDFKFSDLSTIAYNHLLNHPEGYKVKPKFYVINFDDPRLRTVAIPFTRTSWRILRTLMRVRTPLCST